MVRDRQYPISGHTEVDDAAEVLKPHTYAYKSPADEPRSAPNGQKYLGIIAQNMQKNPLTNQSVNETPHGLSVEIKPTVSTLLAMAGRHHDRINAHEGLLSALTGQLDSHARMLAHLHKIISRKIGL